MTKTAIQWYLVVFKLLAGGGAGLLGFIGLSELIGVKKKTDYIALVVALAMIIVGGGFAVLSIGKLSVIMAAVRNISKGSPISLEFLACGLSVIVGAVYLFVKRGENPVAGKVLGVASLLVALAVGYMTGFSHESMPGTPAWHTPTISLGFSTSALLLGGFCYLAITPRHREPLENNKNPDKIVALILIVLAVLTIVITVLHIFKVELGSDLVVYVLLVPVIGAAGSLLFSIGTLLKPMPLWAWLGLAAALAGGIAFRAFVWVTASPHLLSQIDELINISGL